MIYVVSIVEEFEDYNEHKWWWFVKYLELAESISNNPKLSAKNMDFSQVVKDYILAGEELQRQKRRSVIFNGINDS